MYLVHLPLLLLEIPLADREMPIVAELMITTVGAATLLLGSYQLFVRRMLLGRWLNGRLGR